MWITTTNNTTKLTLELREIVESGAKLFDFEYPSYYEGDEKTAFEQKIIDHYYFRQIGQETVGRFKHYLRARMREIMPRYIDLYKTVEIMDGIKDPFGNVDVTETVTETIEGTSTGSAEGTSSDTLNGSVDNTLTRDNSEERTHRMSNTPQGSIDNLDRYMTEAARDDVNSSGTDTQTSTTTNSNEGSTSQTSTTTNTQTITRTFTKTGNQGVNTYAHDMIEYRTSIIDVDNMVIADLNCLFLGVY